MAATIVGIDPGSQRSGWVVYEDGRVTESCILPNNDIRLSLEIWSPLSYGAATLAVEWVEHYGMAVGRDVFDTVRWIGRFQQAWIRPDDVLLIPRREVKLELCGSARAKDPNVRQALIDRFGGKAAAVGRKKTPGPLYGVSGHMWAALAVAVVAEERLTAKAKEAA